MQTLEVLALVRWQMPGTSGPRELGFIEVPVQIDVGRFVSEGCAPPCRPRCQAGSCREQAV